MPKPTRKAVEQDIDAALNAAADIGESLGDDVDKMLANLDAKQEGSPLDKELDYKGGLEDDCKKELSATLKAFKAAAQNEQKVFQDNTDSEYWFCVCFQNRDQKEAFLKALAWFNHGDKYLDGQWVAKKMGVELPPANQRFIKQEREKRMAGELPSIVDLGART